MKTISMVPVESSDIKAVGYCGQHSILRIEFHSGGTYEYDNVPASEFSGLMYAPSKGSYFHANIKNKYSYRKV